MKKYIVLALLFIPMTSFAASSVRVLGNKTAAPVTAAKVTPTKTTTTTNNASTTSRVGTVRAKTKTGTVSAPSTSSDSRFPVIVPAHSYSSVVTPKPAATTTTIVPADVDTEKIINEVTQNVEQHMGDTYITKEEVKEELDDPRFDAIVVADSDPAAKWAAKGKTLPSDYAYMWIEEE